MELQTHNAYNNRSLACRWPRLTRATDQVKGTGPVVSSVGLVPLLPDSVLFIAGATHSSGARLSTFLLPELHLGLAEVVDRIRGSTREPAPRAVEKQ